MSLGGDDVVRQTKDRKYTERLERAQAQKRKWEESKKEAEDEQKGAWQRLEEEIGAGEEPEEDKENADPTFAPRPTRKRKEIEPVYIPPNVLFHPEVTRAAMRAGVSSNALVDIFAAIVSGARLFLMLNKMITCRNRREKGEQGRIHGTRCA